MTAQLKFITWAIACAFLGVITILWSWNTIAGLFEGPEMQARHAIAVLLLLGLVRAVLHRAGDRHRTLRSHGREN